MRNVLDESCRENQNTDFVLNNFFLPKNRVLYEIVWKYMVEPEGSQMTSQYGAYALQVG